MKGRTLFIQQDNAKSHISMWDESFLRLLLQIDGDGTGEDKVGNE